MTSETLDRLFRASLGVLCVLAPIAAIWAMAILTWREYHNDGATVNKVILTTPTAAKKGAK